MNDQPWFKFWVMELFAGDIRAASLATQAVYMRLMAVAHQAEPYGVVQPEGRRGMERLARLACVSLDELQEAWAELEELRIVGEGRLVFERLQADRAEVEAKRQRARRVQGASTGSNQPPASEPAPQSAPDLRSSCAPAAPKSAPELRSGCAPAAPKSAPELRSGCAQEFRVQREEENRDSENPPSPPADAGGWGGPPDPEAPHDQADPPNDEPVTHARRPRCPEWAAVDPEFWALCVRKGITTRVGTALGSSLAAMVAEHRVLNGRPYAEVAPQLWAFVEARARIWSPKALIGFAETVLASCKANGTMPGEEPPPAWEREEAKHFAAVEAMR